jgi:predicted GIY-YIG superfamily endonuclease
MEKTTDLIERLAYWSTVTVFCLQTIAVPSLIQGIFHPTPNEGYEISYFIVMASSTVLYFLIGYQAWVQVSGNPEMGVYLFARDTKGKIIAKAKKELSPSFQMFLFPAGSGEISQVLLPESFPAPQPTPVTPPPPKPVVGPGFIYVMRRADGVYKIGRSTDPTARLSEHIQDYKQEFKLIEWFPVSDMAVYEQLALRMTRQYAYRKEAGRKELRKMTKHQLNQFVVEFKRMIRGAS